MTNGKSDRRGALWGLGFVGFFAGALAILIAAGEPGHTRQEIVSWYESNGGTTMLAGILIGAAGFCLLAFLAGLRTMLRRAEGENGGLATLAFGAGLVLTTMLFAAGGALSAVGTAAEWNGADDVFRVDSSTTEVFFIVGWWFMVYGAVAGGMLAGATAVLALRTGVLPKWHAVVGFVVALAGFASVATWGMSVLAVVAWILLTSVVMLVRSTQSAERTATVAA